MQYTGTSTGTFDFNFSKGVGDSLSGILDNMSNSVYGSVVQTEQNLQSQMSSIDNQVSAIETRVTQDQDTLTQKFVAMETAISQLQSQQQWLTSQLNQLNGSEVANRISIGVKSDIHISIYLNLKKGGMTGNTWHPPVGSAIY